MARKAAHGDVVSIHIAETRTVDGVEESTQRLFTAADGVIPPGLISRPTAFEAEGDDADFDDADDFSEFAGGRSMGRASVEIIDLMTWLEQDSTAGVREQTTIEVDTDTRMQMDDHDMLVHHVCRLLDHCDRRARQQLHRRMDRVNNAYQARTTDGNSCNDEGEMQAASPTNKHNDYLVMPLVHTKVTDTATVLANILFPPTEMYAAISRKDKQAAAKACATRMTQDAKQFAHFTQLYGAVTNLVRYNVAAVMVRWQQIEGQQIQPDAATGKVDFKAGVIHAGNEVVSIDPYNLYWDANVANFMQLSQRGEFVAYAEALSMFDFVKQVRQHKLFGSTGLDLPTRTGVVYISSYPGSYYTAPAYFSDAWELGDGCCGKRPDEMPEGARQVGVGVDVDDWHAEASSASGFGGNNKKSNLKTRGAVELVRAFVRMRGSDFGFVGDRAQDYAIWEIVMLNGVRIVLARPITTPHGRMPIQISAIFQDAESLLREKSLAELMVPFQQHMQDLLAKLQQTLKKGLAGGLTLFNKDKVLLDADKNPISGYVPVQNLPDNVDIRHHVMQLNNLPDSNQTMQHIQSIGQMLENVMPTQQAQQVADLQRATEFQAAATVAASAKRHLTVAKIIDDTLMGPVRQMQYMNLLQNSEPIEIVDDTGEVTQFSPAQLATADLQFDISQGLLGMDRLILSSRYFQLLNLIVQGNMAMQVDFLGMLNYYTSLIGDPTDFNMFRIKSPFDALTPQQKEQAALLLQQAGAAGEGNNGQGTVPAPQQ